LVAALADAAEEMIGRRPIIAVAGPSNIGNLLAQRGIPATCGFGVAYCNAHAANECVEMGSLTPIFCIYRRALERLLAMPS
jgi:succinyl-diaminopimelate desuccinylase